MRKRAEREGSPSLFFFAVFSSLSCNIDPELLFYCNRSLENETGKREEHKKGRNEKKKSHHAEAEAGAAAESLAGADPSGHLGGSLLADAGSGALPQGCGSSESFGISPCFAERSGTTKRERERERDGKRGDEKRKKKRGRAGR